MQSLFLALAVAAALPAGSWSVDPGASTIRYTVVHKLHRVEGVSHELEARAVVKEDGAALTMIRVPLASFRSGDANRDEHMLEAVEAGKYPFVVVKATAQLGPSREVTSAPVVLQGDVDLHGVRTPLTVPVSIEVLPDGSLRARGSFDVSLDVHHVERPSLLFVKIDDACHLDFELVLRGDR